MEEQDEDESRKKSRKETRINFEIYKKYLPEDYKSNLEKYFEICDFHFNVSEGLTNECKPKLEKLAREHYPDFNDNLHPLLADWITTTHETTCFGIAYHMKGLVQRMKNGINIKEQYPKLEEWRAFYFHQKPNTLEDKERNMYLWPDDEAWEEEKKKENREMLRFFLWEQQRKRDFYDIIQPALFRLYPVLESIEGDHWLLYAVNLRDDYEEWLSLMEHVEHIIEYGMPPESINWEKEKFSAESYRIYTEKKLWLNHDNNTRAKLIKAFKLPDE